MVRYTREEAGMWWKKIVLAVGVLSLFVILSSCADTRQGFRYEGVWGHRALVPGHKQVDHFMSIAQIESGVYLVICTSFYESLASDRALGALNRKGNLVVELWGSEWTISGGKEKDGDWLLMYAEPGSEAILDYSRVKGVPVEELVPKKE